MLRKLLAIVVLPALPALLGAQAPSAAAAEARPAVTHGVAVRVQGEVDGQVERVKGLGVEHADQDGDHQDEADMDGHDDGDLDQDGVEPEGPDDDGDLGDQVEQEGEHQDEGDADVPGSPEGTGKFPHTGRHQP